MKRKQLKRGIKDWRMLPSSRSVARGSRWGNPYRVSWRSAARGWYVYHENEFGTALYNAPLDERWTKEQATQKATELYREYAIERLKQEPDWLDPLRGLDHIYCHCEEDAPWCHGDVLIDLVEGK